ncbi:hypothetical protein [Marilutibacter alkalisoli]|uniref:Uncharacterized protein n=1 Tax=Marilutibacter alkalisoli TaxID=2591633 RepID=A0A514BVD4_9GAMM|nr:hypothetical protein [Lysobacter alkalisoli]QDH71336.1 hypothetical protein FKV23_15485 [Lysobacter alkalisoli]
MKQQLISIQHPQRLAAMGVLLLVLAGCQGPEQQGDMQIDAANMENLLSAESSKKDQIPTMGNVEDFIPAGGSLLASQTGDLNGDGIEDVVAVVDLPRDDEQSNDLPPRVTMLLIRDADGQLQKVTQNDALVPCAKCGGLMGDPFGYIRVEPGKFTVVIEGGSRQRWSAEYVFQHSVQSNDWYLQKAERNAYDQISEESVSKTFTSEDFGQISFADFDPSMIQEVVLP